MFQYRYQLHPTFCFLACLESFLAENGQSVPQIEILRRLLNLNAVGNTKDNFGGFAAMDWDKVEKEFNLKAEHLNSRNANFITPKQSLFIMAKWNGQKDRFHSVRFLGRDNEYFYLMNPSVSEFPDKVKAVDFESWEKLEFIVTLL